MNPLSSRGRCFQQCAFWLAQGSGVANGYREGEGDALHRTHAPAAPHAHPCGRATTAHPVWRYLRRLLHPNIPAHSRALLARCEPMHLLVRGPLCAAWRIMPHQPSLPAVLPRKGYPRTEKGALSSGLERTYAPQACLAKASAPLRCSSACLWSDGAQGSSPESMT